MVPCAGEHPREEDGHQCLLHQLGSDVPTRPVVSDEAIDGRGVPGAALGFTPPLGGLPEGQIPNPDAAREEEVGLAALEPVVSRLNEGVDLELSMG